MKAEPDRDAVSGTADVDSTADPELGRARLVPARDPAGRLPRSLGRVGRHLVKYGPGVAAAVAIATAVHLALRSEPLVPDVVAALAVGVLVGSLGFHHRGAPGAALIVRYILRLAIIALGAGFNLEVVASRGWSTILLILVLVMVAMGLGLFLGRVAGLDNSVSVLIGVGTAICGASAILAVSPLIKARPKETAYAVATIFAFNIVALLTLPLIGHQLGISQLRFGTWVGTAVNDTSVVVATGYIYGSTAGGVATAVKLTRTLLLVPMSIFVALAYGAVDDDRASIIRRAARNMPWFVLGFFAMAVLNTAHVVPVAWTRDLTEAGTLLLVVVLAAVGLGVNIGSLRSMGAKPLLIGFALAVLMATISIGLITGLRL